MGAWYGSLESFDKTELYKMKAQNAGAIEITGYPAYVENSPISLVDGWNWIGYIPQNSGEINEALSSIGDSGIYIKTQVESAIYYSNYSSWIGSLEFMYPGEGFMIHMEGSGELIYPNFEFNDSL